MDKLKFIINYHTVIFLKKNLLINDRKFHAFYYLLLVSRTKTQFLSHSFKIIIHTFYSYNLFQQSCSIFFKQDCYGWNEKQK